MHCVLSSFLMVSGCEITLAQNPGNRPLWIVRGCWELRAAQILAP